MAAPRSETAPRRFGNSPQRDFGDGHGDSGETGMKEAELLQVHFLSR